MYFNMVIFLMLFSTAVSLMCFKCKEGNEEDCNLKQVKTECKNYEDHCYTAFKSSGDGTDSATKQFLWKGCVDGRRCQNQCDWYKRLKKKCQVSCCVGNECNKHGITIQRNRRQYDNKGALTSFKWWLTFLCAVVPSIWTNFAWFRC